MSLNVTINESLKVGKELSEPSATTERARWLPQPGQVLRAKTANRDGFDFLVLWPHRDAFAALDGTERYSGAGAASNNRTLTRVEALAKIEAWQGHGAEFELSPGNGDYGVWAEDLSG